MKNLASLFTLLIFTVAATAQDLGPHDINGQGCMSCHGSTAVDPGNAGSDGWGNFSQTTYTTYGGQTLTVAASLTDNTPSSHSAVCMACHDSSLADTGLSHAKSHPVNIPYTVGTDGHWPGTVTATGVRFTPTHFDSVYGHPVRFYVASGKAYVECSSCHDPHYHSVTPVTINGQNLMKPTEHFVRGWYDDRNPTGNSVSQFCRSCHYGQSNEFYGVNAATD